MREVIKQGLEDWRAKRSFDWATFQDMSDSSQLPDQPESDPLQPSPSPRVRTTVEETATANDTVRSRLPAGAPHLVASRSFARTLLTSPFSRLQHLWSAHAQSH
jgi:hypothetical protein